MTKPILVAAAIEYPIHDDWDRCAFALELRSLADKPVYSFMNLTDDWTFIQKEWYAQTTTHDVLRLIWVWMKPDPSFTDLRPPTPDQIEWIRSKLDKIRGAD